MLSKRQVHVSVGCSLKSAQSNDTTTHTYILQINQAKPECGRQTLVELLIRPVQRLPSVALLLNGNSNTYPFIFKVHLKFFFFFFANFIPLSFSPLSFSFHTSPYYLLLVLSVISFSLFCSSHLLLHDFNLFLPFCFLNFPFFSPFRHKEAYIR